MRRKPHGSSMMGLNDLPSSKREAKKKGMSKFYTGVPCKYGHLTTREASNGKCRECQRIKGLEWRHNNPERSNEHSRKYRERNPEKSRESSRKWDNNNLEYRRKYKKENEQKIKDYLSNYYQENKHYYRERSSRRRAMERNATPEWADLELIKYYYWACKMINDKFGTDFEMDHIVPIKGKNVCGLHVENNFQLLTRKENTSKNNSFDDQTPWVFDDL